MLYSKNKKDKKLDIDLFKNPTSDYRATPFWAWNCELERDELCRQIDILRKWAMAVIICTPVQDFRIGTWAISL